MKEFCEEGGITNETYTAEETLQPIQQFINRMPKIDLHCHLDGSLSPATIRVLAERVGIDLPVIRRI